MAGKKRSIESLVLQATTRALENMAIKDGKIDGGWEPSALATWVAPTVSRAIRRMLQREREER